MPIEISGILCFTQNWYGETSLKNLNTVLFVKMQIF